MLLHYAAQFFKSLCLSLLPYVISLISVMISLLIYMVTSLLISLTWSFWLLCMKQITGLLQLQLTLFPCGECQGFYYCKCMTHGTGSWHQSGFIICIVHRELFVSPHRVPSARSGRMRFAHPIFLVSLCSPLQQTNWEWMAEEFNSFLVFLKLCELYLPAYRLGAWNCTCSADRVPF